MKGFSGFLVSLLPGAATAANTIDITGAGPANIGVDYACDANAGVVGIKAIVGHPNADSPSATGIQTAVICDGNSQNTAVTLTGIDGAPAISQGQLVQVRAALVDLQDAVIAGTANVFTIG